LYYNLIAGIGCVQQLGDRNLKSSFTDFWLKKKQQQQNKKQVGGEKKEPNTTEQCEGATFSPALIKCH
jgi:hypothetical protein